MENFEDLCLQMSDLQLEEIRHVSEEYYNICRKILANRKNIKVILLGTYHDNIEDNFIKYFEDKYGNNMNVYLLRENYFFKELYKNSIIIENLELTLFRNLFELWFMILDSDCKNQECHGKSCANLTIDQFIKIIIEALIDKLEKLEEKGYKFNIPNWNNVLSLGYPELIEPVKKNIISTLDLIMKYDQVIRKFDYDNMVKMMNYIINDKLCKSRPYVYKNFFEQYIDSKRNDYYIDQISKYEKLNPKLIIVQLGTAHVQGIQEKLKDKYKANYIGDTTSYYRFTAEIENIIK